MNIAFLGLGNMGMAMAVNLLRAGHSVTAFNRTAAKATSLADHGARVASSPAEAVKSADLVVTMLANDAAVRETVLDPMGDGSPAIERIPRGGLHMSASTISPALSQLLANEHAARGQEYVAAPVLGR